MEVNRYEWLLRTVFVLLCVSFLAACGSAPTEQASSSSQDMTIQATQALETAVSEEPSQPQDMGVLDDESPVSSDAEDAEDAEGYTTIYGEPLPEDAAPYDMQIYKVACDASRNQTAFDTTNGVYRRICATEGKLNDLFQDQLVTLDKDYHVIPASAESWDVSEDGLTWTFHIKPGLEWSDGTPLTAHDWVATYRVIADPDHAWDFAWFYKGVIEHWDEILAGDKPPEELGVEAVDDLTLQFTLQKPMPAFLAMMQNSYVLQKAAIEEHGPEYNSNVATTVSSGPFILTKYEPGVIVEMEANPTYKGYRKPLLKRLIGEYRDMNTAFPGYQNHELDYVAHFWLVPEHYEAIESAPLLSENYLRHYGDFRTVYLFFDTNTAPFDDINVRKAFAHAIDREAIVQKHFGELKAMPAYSMLMPGFPASDTEGTLHPYQEYDCGQAQSYLADAGYPGGEGFPPLEMWLRNESGNLPVYEATAQSIQACLGVDITVQNKDFKLFMEWLMAKPTKLQFGSVTYGMDFLDPANLLGVWVSGGRHAWENEAYDRLVSEASSIADEKQRLQMFQEAEEILVDDVGGVFLAHLWSGDLVQPYLVGEGLRG